MTISSDSGYVTLINVFSVEPEHQQRLLDLLTLATESGVSKVKGFVSSSLHRSVDGKKVTMYAQWKSAEDYNAMRANTTTSPYLEEALTFAKFDPGMYEVVKVFKHS